MTDVMERRPPTATRGPMFLAAPSLLYGISWPVSKFVMTEWPPLPLRGLTGLAGATALSGYGLIRGDVTVWMRVMGLALLWLPASEAAGIADTMPIWTVSATAPGEPLSAAKTIALAMTLAGVALAIRA